MLARFLQGLSTAAARVIATSIVRDCYSGRRMASVMSLAMMIFISVPIIAEGRFEQPEQLEVAFAAGAHAVVVGTAITNPREITRRFARHASV